MTAIRTCAHCLKTIHGPSSGSVGDGSVCHPDNGMDCYRLVTVYQHPMPCPTCQAVRNVDLAILPCARCELPVEPLVRSHHREAAMMLQALGYDVIPPSGTVL